MSKYIVKNCPGLLKGAEKWAKGFKEDEYFCNEGEGKWCQDCTDCVMKQIVKKCRKSLEVSYCPIEQEILELLDIQEMK